MCFNCFAGRLRSRLSARVLGCRAVSFVSEGPFVFSTELDISLPSLFMSCLSLSVPSLSVPLYVALSPVSYIPFRLSLDPSLLGFLLSGILRAAPERVRDRDREPKPPPSALGRSVGRMQESHQGPRPHRPVHGLRRVSLPPHYSKRSPSKACKRNTYSYIYWHITVVTCSTLQSRTAPIFPATKLILGIDVQSFLWRQ